MRAKKAKKAKKGKKGRKVGGALDRRAPLFFLSFVPFVWGDYWIIGLDDSYRWAVVGTPDRGYLWILSRTPVLDEKMYEQALEKVRQNGFDPAKLLKTRQGA